VQLAAAFLKPACWRGFQEKRIQSKGHNELVPRGVLWQTLGVVVYGGSELPLTVESKTQSGSKLPQSKAGPGQRATDQSPRRSFAVILRRRRPFFYVSDLPYEKTGLDIGAMIAGRRGV